VRRRLFASGLVLALALVAAPTASAGGDGSADQQVAVVDESGSIDAREVSSTELRTLEAEGAGRVVTRGRSAAPELTLTVPKVGAPSYWGIGQRGAGQVIAVIDSGVAGTFGGTLVGQACFAATQRGSVLDGHCGPNGDVTEAFDSTCFSLGLCGAGDTLDPAAARPCAEPATPERCAHGTAVAAVAARREPTPGVAPDAGVYAIQVFDPTGVQADFVDILLALDHVADLADAGMAIAAANLSLSSTALYPTHCDVGPAPDFDAAAFRTVIQRLIDRGIPTTVATGNDSRVGSVGLPACVSNAVAVAASDLDDQMADFGNRGPTVDLVAPGAREGNGAIDPMVIPGNPVSRWAGTSFASPHVAAAFALLQSEFPKASVAQLLSHLRLTGVPAVDPATGGTYRRLLLRRPSESLPAGALFPASASVAGTPWGVVGDYDGDGFDDVLAYAPGTAGDRISYGRDSWAPAARGYVVSGSYVPIVGSFRGSGADDIVWYAPGTAADRLWTGASSRTFASSALTINGSYFPIVGDYDGDGFDDIAWYAPGPAGDSLWFGGPSGFTPRPLALNGTYRVATGDVNGDGREDLLFHGPGAASDALWLGTPTRGSWAKSSLSIGGTNVLRTGDLDGDGDDDLLLYQPGAAADAIWRGGPTVGAGGATGGFSPLAISVTGSYVPSVGDIDADGFDDILWYGAGPTTDAVWFGRPTGGLFSRTMSVSGTYTALLADLDGDGGKDIVWFQGARATTPLWWSHPG
jgi:hypothetical protein